jgi:hypothetical protein
MTGKFDEENYLRDAYARASVEAKRSDCWLKIKKTAAFWLNNTLC